MNIIKVSAILVVALVLVACGQSKESQFYVLNPLPPKNIHSKKYNDLRIGIDKVSSPEYIQRPQLTIHYTKHRVELEEYNRWAEALNSNIKRVVAANLSTLLPGAVVESSPWDSKFQPNYHLQVIISQFEISIHGNSILRAEYLIYHNDKLIKKRDVYYRSKLIKVTPEALVTSMNSHLTHLTRDIAQFFKYRR